MSFELPCSLLTIVVDAELDTLRRGFDQQGRLEAVISKLLALFTEYRIPTTWAVADPAISAATDRIIAEAGRHEIAVLGDRTWVGHSAGRNRFGNELQRRVTHGRSAGLEISSLVLRDAELDDHSDLVVKLGIKSIATSPVKIKRRIRLTPVLRLPQQIRFGLWTLPASYKLPGGSRWLLGGGGSIGVRRSIDTAISKNLPALLLLNCLDLAARPSGCSVLETLCKHIAKRRDQSMMQVVTQSVMADRITGDRQSAPSHSILRPAA
jgi:hypothetical protein